jgi:hypothetical protein
MIHFIGYAYGPFYLEDDDCKYPISDLWSTIQSSVEGHIAVTRIGVHNGFSALFFADFSNHPGLILEVVSLVIEKLSKHDGQVRFQMWYTDQDSGTSLAFTSDCK